MLRARAFSPPVDVFATISMNKESIPFTSEYNLILCVQILVNRGLLLLSKNDFVSAQEKFEKAAGAAAAALPAKQAPRQSNGTLLLFHRTGGHMVIPLELADTVRMHNRTVA